MVQLDRFSFDCSDPVLVMNINESGNGEFVPYSEKINLDLIQSAYGKTYFLSSTPLHELQRTAKHPEELVCESRLLTN